MSEPETRETPETATPSRGRRIVRRVLLGIGWTIAALMALGIALYLFGGMWMRTPEMRGAYDDLVASGQQPALEGAFVVPIPGCVCHSDDPLLQAEHSQRHIRDCSICH